MRLPALIKHAQAELVCLYQVRSHASTGPATSRPVVELHNGFRLSLMYNFDFTK